MRDPIGFWRRCRVLFRQLCRMMIFAALVLACAILWLNKIGLPDFLKRSLVETLHARGVESEFTRLRLSLGRGLVADNVHIGRTEKAGEAVLSLQQAQLQLDYRALLHRQLQINGLALRQGKFVWPLSPTNTLVLDHIQADLRFQTNDTWSLDNFQADFAGAKLTLSGDVAHASALRNWEIFRGATTNAVAQQAGLQKIADTLRQIRLAGTSRLSLDINGDARDPRSFLIRLMASIPAVDTPWGLARGILLTAKLKACAGTPANPDSSWAWWTNMQPYQLEWAAWVSELKSKDLNARSVLCSGFWRAPELIVTNLSAKLDDGQLNASMRLNVATREFTFTNSSCFDPRAIAALLTEKTQNWLAQFSWTQPPLLQASGSLILPAWINPEGFRGWRSIMQPTIRLAGGFIVTNGAFRGITADLARGHFFYSNLVWQLPDLVVTRPEGALALANTENDDTKSYHWHIRGVLNPEAIRPVLTANNAERSLELFTFTEPLFLDADMWGRLHDYDSIGVAGRMALTNFTIRGEAVESVESTFHYTNRFLEFFQPHLQTGAQTMSADGIAADFNSWRIYFTNGFSTADPRSAARAIGPKTGKIMEPYRFGQPCSVRVNGYTSLHGVDNTDLRFDLDGAPLEWLRLKTPSISGEIHWLGQILILTNLTAKFYGGNATGSAYFDFHPKEGADFKFVANVENANVHWLATDLSSPTNRLEGVLGGRFIMTSANSENRRAWNGYGQANLHDGLIWDVPIFGIVSPVLNTVAPGLGSSRATDATARFTMTNGVVFSDDLEIRSTMMRLEYTGTVDLQSRVNAYVTAQLLRDTWVVGPFVSTALWPVSKLFEYKISGTLEKPESEPVYIPKFLLMPLHPIRSLEGMLSGGTDTNPPPVK
jgi:hypothetical protein